MQKFGFEIRKIGNVEKLYEDVNVTLGKYNIPNGSISRDVQTQTVAHSLQKMFKPSSHFSVCCIRSNAELCCIIIPSERMNVYSSIHCMDWNDMLPDFRMMITAMVLDDFRGILNPEDLN